MATIVCTGCDGDWMTGANLLNVRLRLLYLGRIIGREKLS
jgi:hypothetical protein